MPFITSEFSSNAPVFFQYAGQCQPQDAYIALDADGHVYADFSEDIGNAVPTDVWSGLNKRISISPLSSARSLQQLFTDADFVSAVNRYYAGRSTEWNGSNWTSELSEDAESAFEELEQMCCPYPGIIRTLSIWNAGDWVMHDGLSVMQEELLAAGSVQAFFEAQLLCSDADHILNFNADDLAKALAYRFEGKADYRDAIEIIVEHDPDYRYLLNGFEE